MIDEAPIGAFLDDVASERVTPAGGTVVAVSGAMGAALCEMACIHTLAARDESEDVDADDAATVDFEALRADLAGQRRRLLALAEQDAALVDDLFGGGSASDSGEDDDEQRGPSDRLSKRAAGIPLATAEAALAVLEDAAVVIDRGRPGVAADAKAGAYLADAAVRASLATVEINVSALDDASHAADLRERAAQIAADAADLREDVLNMR
ncbi:cyclodeaminase/cyclohydrolase family protein [Halobellus rufus]|uniref:cyclodeaminase/cyclohydrolase family protein n=1 Tax=Halobellus rufus TaxID=1448860 RepID=UPI00067845A1|nr:cyclodeaminase/cyclohydrolase family protein [Halobellus rufus]